MFQIYQLRSGSSILINLAMIAAAEPNRDNRMEHTTVWVGTGMEGAEFVVSCPFEEIVTDLAREHKQEVKGILKYFNPELNRWPYVEES